MAELPSYPTDKIAHGGSAAHPCRVVVMKCDGAVFPPLDLHIHFRLLTIRVLHLTFRVRIRTSHTAFFSLCKERKAAF